MRDGVLGLELTEQAPQLRLAGRIELRPARVGHRFPSREYCVCLGLTALKQVEHECACRIAPFGGLVALDCVLPHLQTLEDLERALDDADRQEACGQLALELPLARQGDAVDVREPFRDGRVFRRHLVDEGLQLEYRALDCPCPIRF